MLKYATLAYWLFELRAHISCKDTELLPLPHRHKQEYGDYQRERELEETEEDRGRINSDERFDLGSKHTIQYTDIV